MESLPRLEEGKQGTTAADLPGLVGHVGLERTGITGTCYGSSRSLHFYVHLYGSEVLQAAKVVGIVSKENGRFWGQIKNDKVKRRNY